MAYEKGKPEPGIKAKLLDDRVRGNNDFIQPAINNEHNFVDADAGNQSGDHTQGSARCFSQATAPATRIDGSSFESTDIGSLWVDTDDNAMYILTAITPTWTPISTEIIELLLASPRTFLDTLDVTGKLTALAELDVGTSIDIAGTIPIVGVIDDDTMGTATDTNLSTSEAIKTYVDNQMFPVTETADTSSAGTTLFGNGLRIARGIEAVLAGAVDTVTISNFTKIYDVQLTIIDSGTADAFAPKLQITSDTTFTIRNTGATNLSYGWRAIGR